MPKTMPTRWWWLTRWTWGPGLPFGWRVYGRASDGVGRFNAFVIGPTWFYPCWWLWQERWAPVRLLLWLGLFELEPGGYYRNARPVGWPGRDRGAQARPHRQ